MDRIFQALRPFIRFVVKQAGWVLLLALMFSAVGVNFLKNLSVDTDLSNLIPPEYNSVQALEKLRATVGGEETVDVAIVSPFFQANKAFAEALIPQALRLSGEQEAYFSHVDYKRDTEFMKNNALYFATSEELDELETYLEDQIEEARLEANPFFFDLEDEEPEPDTTAESLQQVYNDIVGKEYPVSEDSTALVLRLYPTGSQTDVGLIEEIYEELDSLIVSMDPSTYHAEMEVVTAGRPLRRLTEVKTISDDVLGSFLAGVLTVLFVVVSYFLYKGYRARSGKTFSATILLGQIARIPVLALLIGVPLLIEPFLDFRSGLCKV